MCKFRAKEVNNIACYSISSMVNHKEFLIAMLTNYIISVNPVSSHYRPVAVLFTKQHLLLLDYFHEMDIFY